MADEYQNLGVSAMKADVHKAIRVLPPPAYPGAFCHLVVDPWDASQVMAMHADGSGTKANVAYIAARELGGSGWFRGLAQDSAVMNIDDLICVGAVGPYVLSNTIGRNAQVIGGDLLQEVLEGYHGFATQMAACGVEIMLAGGETADCGDTVQTIVVDSTVCTRMPAAAVIDFSRVRPGDVIVGLSSSGRATYETAENSGIGSNGFTLARHALLSSEYRKAYPETYARELDLQHVYRGTLKVGDMLPGTQLTVAEALLSPTRTYAPVVKELLRQLPDAVHGLIHNTGGGLTKCIRFGKGLRFVKRELLPLPPVQRAIREISGVGLPTMAQTFNCGHRLEIYCPAADAQAVMRVATQFGIESKVVGEVVPLRRGGEGNEVEVLLEGQTLEFGPEGLVGA
ncbi:AIR synthase-related protein [Ramlibacter sp.]|uniref:AIR synthase-related protein n=1 Tax=Ramlibacter sp. TaxID=1917967 RepID=UPI0017E9EE29|nr:AIR synthase-related protein [Ramlibacter sp.]MBA2676186.1 phosphoribosylformylglycinamidine cyclo-ligase [Ramlibacter sp.]